MMLRYQKAGLELVKRPLFSKHPVNQPVNTVSQFFGQLIGQFEQNGLQTFVLEDAIQDGVAAQFLSRDLPGQEGTYEKGPGMMLEIGEALIDLSFERLCLAPESPDLLIQGFQGGGFFLLGGHSHGDF